MRYTQGAKPGEGKDSAITEGWSHPTPLREWIQAQQLHHCHQYQEHCTHTRAQDTTVTGTRNTTHTEPSTRNTTGAHYPKTLMPLHMQGTKSHKHSATKDTLDQTSD